MPRHSATRWKPPRRSVLSASFPDDGGLAPITERLDLALLGALPDAVECLLLRLWTPRPPPRMTSPSCWTRCRRWRGFPAMATCAPPMSRRSAHLLEGFAARIHAGLGRGKRGIDERCGGPAGQIHSRDYATALAMLENAASNERFPAGAHENDGIRERSSEAPRPAVRLLARCLASG